VTVRTFYNAPDPQDVPRQSYDVITHGDLGLRHGAD
jgi:hypothetical protein